MNKIAVYLGSRLLLSVSLLGVLLSAPVSAAPSYDVLQLDTSYDKMLQWEASPDKTVTPARVLHWIGSLWSNTAFVDTHPNTEFEPIVHARNNDVNVVAAIAYKF